MWNPQKHGKNLKGKKRSQEAPNFNEEKILNALSKEDMIMNVCDAFEEVLNELSIESRDEKIYEKLCIIQNLIQLKTSHLQIHDDSFEEFGNLNLPTLSRSSMQSLLSESSSSSLDNDPNFKKFLKQVNCPFCEKSQVDKIKLISHLSDSCRPLMNGVFAEKGKHVLYSVFQILPNNDFKCNVCMTSVGSKVKKYFLHATSENHKKNYDLLVKRKMFTNYFFCSCCKVLVPDNYTEFEFHINHQVHLTKSKLSFDKKTFFKKGIQCIYIRNKKFHCIVCNLKFGTPKEILNHMTCESHLANKRRKNVQISLTFCEFCEKEVRADEVLQHFFSTTHKMAENKREEHFEMCFYCGFTCDKLSELATHMKTNCNEINKLRESIMKTNFTENNSQTVKPEKKKDLKENCNPEQKNYIIVKDNTKLPELYGYFKEIGEICSIEIHKKRNAIIHFKEKTSVHDVLLLRDVIKINGVKVEITTKEEEQKAEKKEAENNKREMIKNDYEKSDGNYETENVGISESEDSDTSNSSGDEYSLDEKTRKLFQRVSTHLLENIYRLDPILERQLLLDVGDTFHCQSFALIGFTGCELSFPLENISIYCDIPELLSDNTHSLNSDTFIYNKSIVKVLFRRILKSSSWEDAFCSLEAPFPCIQCKHNNTKTNCTFTFMRPAKIVSDLLRHYLEKSDVIKSFAVITRFWINVNELSIREHEFAIISLLISFLVMEDIVEPDTALNSVAVVFHFCEALRALNVDNPSQKKKKNYDITAEALFLRFLRFLNEFDFARNVIYLPFKCPVPKIVLKKAPICSLLANYEISDCSSSTMCVIDPFLNVNLTSNVSEEDVEDFLETIKITLRKT